MDYDNLTQENLLATIGTIATRDNTRLNMLSTDDSTPYKAQIQVTNHTSLDSTVADLIKTVKVTISYNVAKTIKNIEMSTLITR